MSLFTFNYLNYILHPPPEVSKVIKDKLENSKISTTNS